MFVCKDYVVLYSNLLYEIYFAFFQNVLGLKNIPRDFVHMIYETFRNIPETKFVGSHMYCE